MNKINLFYASLEPIYSNFDKYLKKLSSKRQRKILSMKDFDAKVHSLGGALLLNEAALRMGIDLQEVLYTDKGKPYLEDNSFYFSISHSKGFALCSFGKIESGCDIQVKRSVNLKIAERFFSEAERKVVFESKNQSDEFLKTWCLKESAYKLVGVNDCVIQNKYGIVFKEYNVSEDFYITVCAFENAFNEPEKIEF
ncbi:MAG: 4'-phosphopantetheinyl transferase superfamily protein [Clostridia bacterium]|nr:4'-phosphopantetheinyl transferase superfamily protein [Clostridia bacterium]